MTGVSVVRHLAGLFATAWVAGSASASGIGFKTINVDVKPIESFARTIAADGAPSALEFRGGLEISSPDASFGGLSGLDFTPDGNLVAVADIGFWFCVHPIEANGRPVGLSDARLAPILDERGRPTVSKRAGDAEGLRILVKHGRLEALVSFEQQARIRRFVAAPDLAKARAQAVPLPKSVSGLEANAGLEALAVAPTDSPLSGATVVIAERSLDQNGNHRGWILDGPRRGAFSLIRSDAFDVTDAAFLPSGDLLVLERSASFLTGFAMRIRRLSVADLLPGETIDGRILIEADMRYQIDNMEGMALRPDTQGSTRIALISDDNMNPLQRTLLLEFTLPPDPLPIPRPRAGTGQ